MREKNSRPVLWALLFALALSLAVLASQAEPPAAAGEGKAELPVDRGEASVLKGNGPFDCALGCHGELGQGNSCVETTTCTPEQLAECLPGFSMCDEHGEHDEHDDSGALPDEHSYPAAAGVRSPQSPAPGF